MKSKELITEHAMLINNIAKTNEELDKIQSLTCDDKYEKTVMAEFSNLRVQLNGMDLYEKALYARMQNAGIEFDGIHYKKNVARLNEVLDSEEDKSESKHTKPNTSDCGETK